MNRVTFTEVRDRMTGQWQACLEALGLPSSAFEKGNHPCVFCGGTDRANYGNRQHPETYYCRQCADRGLDGFSLLQGWHGWTAVEALQAVAGWLGVPTYSNIVPFARLAPVPTLAGLATLAGPPDKKGKMRTRIRQVWREADPISSSPIAQDYLSSRGLVGLPSLPANVRLHPGLPYWWLGHADTPVKLGTFPALVALVQTADGKVTGLHRTYLQSDGSGKLAIASPDGEPLPAKKLLAVAAGATAGCSVQLFPLGAAGVLAIAEGIETALAVMTLWGVPCWSVLSASNMERFELPAGIQEIAIFTDADESGAGQHAGKVLARRVLAMESPPTVRIATPTAIGTDWLDYLNSIVLEEVSHG